MEPLTFRKGLKDGLPIALGYISVAFAFGTLAVTKGFPAWLPITISLSCFTGTGQFAGIDLIYSHALYLEIACTILIINLRYMLMSLAISQKLSPQIHLGQRFILAFGVTDEIYATAIQQKTVLTFSYLIGLILCSFSGWVGGTILGAVAGNIFPDSLQNALGIVLYAMFIAIIIPPARDSGAVTKIIFLSVGLSCLFFYIPFLSTLSSGWVIIICGVVAAGAGALLFPVSEQEESKDGV